MKLPGTEIGTGAGAVWVARAMPRVEPPMDPPMDPPAVKLVWELASAWARTGMLADRIGWGAARVDGTAAAGGDALATAGRMVAGRPDAEAPGAEAG